MNNNYFYCKEKDIPKTKTRKEFLRYFLIQKPYTYFKNNKIQCDCNTNRSISDLLIIVRARFKKTSLNALIRILAELNKEGLCYIVWCTQKK